MKPENAIEVHDLKKTFKVYMDKGHSIKEKVLFSNRNRYEIREVLKGVSFEVKKGEAVGLIGHNGCGKSTTLKLLTKIIYPDSGSIEMAGRVASLIELGAGFHPDMSGRENIYINAAIFGLTRKEINERLNDIIAFSELEEFIDNPVRTYSSGMYMRLAFSVAINVKADILLVDEILAVGDAAFQVKCFDKMQEIKKQGTTIVIVSHALNQIEQICDRSLWLNEGILQAEGLPGEVDSLYMDYMSRRSGTRGDEADKSNDGITGTKEAEITSISAYNSDGIEKRAFNCNEPCRIEIKYKARKKITDAVFGIAIYSSDHAHLYGTNTMIDTAKKISIEGEGSVIMDIHHLPFNEGSYSIDFTLHRPNDIYFDYWREGIKLQMMNPHNEVGYISLDHDWIVK